VARLSDENGHNKDWESYRRVVLLDLDRLTDEAEKLDKRMTDMADKTAAMHEENKKAMAALEKTIEKRWNRLIGITIGVYVVWGFMTGSGIATLSSLLKAAEVIK
jgi:hypothetical protein